ncbi:MAG TPA: type II secretion system F family protein [Chloroflexia bacterium]|nr:type II secretion system F family protein [Chloroflexia bacterium]
MNPLIIAAIVALAILALFFVLARVSGGSSNFKGRLERFAGDGQKEVEETKGEKKKFSLGIGQSELAAKVDKSFGRQTFGRSVQRKLAQADLKLTLLEFMIGKVGGMLVGLAIGMYLGRGGAVMMMICGVSGVVLGFFVPDWFVKFRIAKRMKAFNDQLAETIGLVANSLRSGYSLLQSLELVSKESPDPIGTEFRRVVREVGLGISPQEALQNLYARMPSDDLDLLITAINIQYEVGGNLAQILDTISHTIRERVRIKGEIGVLTAQGRISGYLVTSLPFFIGGVVTLINPEYMNELWTFPWIIMPICGFIMVVAGFLIIRKIVNIEV